MQWNEGLTGEALNIAGSDESPLRVMAGPGTGKTFAIKRRVARLMEEGVNPERILVITFTRVAAADLINELHNLEIPGCNNIDARTLHSFCYRMLSREAIFNQIGRIPRQLIYFNKAGSLQFEAAPLLSDLTGRQFGGRRDCASRIRAFEAAWSRLQTDEPGWPQDPIDNLFHRELESWLRFHKAMLIGELVPEALRFLRGNPHAMELTAYDHVIVDEYQDLNRAEQELINILSRNGDIIVVGDEDQSIYSFRFANPEGIVQFNDTHPETVDFELLECRRCPPNIVDIADALIRNNHINPGLRRLHPKPDMEPGIIKILQWYDITSEAEGIAQYISHLISSGEYQPQEILILCPRRYIGGIIRDSIQTQGINAHSFYHEELLEPQEAQKAFSILTLMVNPDDRVSLRYLLGCESNTHLSRQYSILRQRAEDDQQEPNQILQRCIAQEIQIARITNLLNRFKEVNQSLIDLRDLSAMQVIDRLFPAGEDWTSGIRDLIDNSDDLKAFHNRLKNFVSQPEIPENIDYVRIMSLHKSKGLTSRVVILSDCIEGLIPGIDRNAAAQERTIREARRLFYVAITRSKEILIISSIRNLNYGIARQIGAQTRGRRTITSRFINELGHAAPHPITGENWVQSNFD